MEAEEVRARLEACRPLRGAGYDAEVRQVVVSYVAQERTRGRTWEQIGTTVGLSGTTLQNWSKPVARFVPVAVVASPQPPAVVEPVSLPPPIPPTGSGLMLHTPAGFRLEGLDLQQALALLTVLR